MVDIKKILEASIRLNVCENLGELYGSYLTENILFENSNGEIFNKNREAFEELKRLMPIWKEKYGFDENTKLADVLNAL